MHPMLIICPFLSSFLPSLQPNHPPIQHASHHPPNLTNNGTEDRCHILLVRCPHSNTNSPLRLLPCSFGPSAPFLTSLKMSCIFRSVYRIPLNQPNSSLLKTPPTTPYSIAFKDKLVETSSISLHLLDLLFF